METIDKIFELCYKHGNEFLNYQIELRNQNTVQICTDRRLVFLNWRVKDCDEVCYNPECINTKPEAVLQKILKQVKASIMHDMKKDIEKIKNF